MEQYIAAYNSMGESGNAVIDYIFMVCVMLLVDLANVLGVSYEFLNIVIFVAVHPLLTLAFLSLWLYERFVR